MPDIELLLKIDAQFWPKGVMRSLPSLLRNLGDKHGNLVIAAVPSKHIMVKGDSGQIDKAKPAIRELITAHFPDAPMPEELAEEVAAPVPSPEPAPTPSPKVEPKAAPKIEPKAALKVEPKAPSQVVVSNPPVAAVSKPAIAVSTAIRKRPYVEGMMASPSLLWECTRKTSSFVRNPLGQFKKPFSAEPHNLLGWHAQRFSGLASHQVVDVKSKKKKKEAKDTVALESVALVLSSSRASRHSRPCSRTHSVGLSKCSRNGLAQLDAELGRKFYQPALLELAKKKYLKVHASFKKKRTVKKAGKVKK